MASEILGLFGGKSSQQLRGDALDGLLVSPAQMGSQSLLAGGQAAANANLAGAIAGAQALQGGIKGFTGLFSGNKG